MGQFLLVIALILMSGLYVGFRICRLFRGKSSGGCGKACSNCAKSNSSDGFVSADQLR